MWPCSSRLWQDKQIVGPGSSCRATADSPGSQRWDVYPNVDTPVKEREPGILADEGRHGQASRTVSASFPVTSHLLGCITYISPEEVNDFTHALVLRPAFLMLLLEPGTRTLH